MRRSRPPKSKLLGTGALFGIVIAAASSLMLLRTHEPAACERLLPLKIAATPAIAPAIQAITSRDVQLPCVEITVVTQTAAKTAEAITVADGEVPALWIPDSTLWPQRAAQQAAPFAGTPSIEQRDPLAISPLVLVTTGIHGASLGWPAAPVGWRDLVGGQATGAATTIGNPLLTTEGLATLTAVRSVVGGPDEAPKPELIGAMLQVGRDAAPSIQSVYDRLGSAGEPLAFTATEQSVVSYNRGGANLPAVAIYPREGTIALEYPLVRVTEPDEPPAVAEAAGRVERALRTPTATSTLLTAGFRSPQGDLDPSIAATLGVPPSKPPLLPSPTADQAADVLAIWSAVTLESRMLVVTDISGSMNADAGDGRSKIELARDVSTTALSLFPDTASIGLWGSSAGKAPPKDWIEMVPLGLLSDSVGDKTRRQALLAGVQSLPFETGGATALNDTVLAAFRSVRGSYEPGKVNSVVLFTAGRNEDSDSIDTQTLVQTLRKENDPATPVPVIIIGIGPQVGFEALQQISGVTGGKAYLAQDPDDIRGVLLDALTLRQCRPAC